MDPSYVSVFNNMQHFIYKRLTQYISIYDRCFKLKSFSNPKVLTSRSRCVFLSDYFQRQLQLPDILNTLMSEDKKCSNKPFWIHYGGKSAKNLGRANECVSIWTWSRFTLQRDIYESVNKVYCNFSLFTRLRELFKMSWLSIKHFISTIWPCL